MILNESTRDNMLLPYVQKMNDAGKEISLGQLKSLLLKLLADNAGIHNLSLRSNFYLAGTARYYFNGDLTTDRNVGLLTGEQDNFNREICDRLNALIKILRNAYIDTIGTTFEQPEDFGTLKINALLKKYNAKINKELGISTKQEKEVEEDTLDRTPNVGNGYSFEIIYSYNLGTKYCAPTSPGSWCVTYGEHHFNYYPKNTTPPSHLVVFRQDGWEKIDRQNGMDKSKWVSDGYGRSPRPHDPYANSLIAYFQGNNTWEAGKFNGAPLITSRWNHGSTDTGSLEADRAYTQEEFMKITGVSEDELKRIFEIWKKDSPKKEEKKKNTLSAEEKQQRLDFLRKLKYAQMRANGGENLESVIDGLKITAFFTNATALNKGIASCDLDGNCFLVDKGHIVFDAILYNQTSDAGSFINGMGNPLILANSIIIKKNTGSGKLYSVYNYRLHKIIEVEGLSEFVSISLSDGYYHDKSEPYALEFTQRGKRSILFDCKSGMPIKMPNGRYIFEYCKYNGSGYGVTTDGGWITANDIVFIMVDSSSMEAYTYCPLRKTFNVFDKENFDGFEEIRYAWFGGWGGRVPCLAIEGGKYERNTWARNFIKEVRYFLFDKDGKQMNIFPDNKGYSRTTPEGIFKNYVALRLNSIEFRKLGVRKIEDSPVALYNYVTKEYARLHNGELIRFRYAEATKYQESNVIIVQIGWRSNNFKLLDLDNLVLHDLRCPSGINGIWPESSLSTENFITIRIGGYMQDNDELHTMLKQQNFALWPGKPYYFIAFDDALNDVPTTPQNFDINAAIASIPNNEEVNESVIAIGEKDIMEMVQKACEIIIENKILWKK